jgi:FtsZ-binding cell division protein ZapB
MEDANVINTQPTQPTQNIEEPPLTTDDLLLIIGEKTMELFQSKRIENLLRNRLQESYDTINILSNDNKKLKNKETGNLDNSNKIIELNLIIEKLESENIKLKKEHKIVQAKLQNKIHNLRNQLNDNESDNTIDNDELDNIN